MKKYILSLYSLLFLLPILSFATTKDAATGLEKVITTVQKLLGLIFPIIGMLATLYFLWSLVKFLQSSGSDKEDAKQQMIWGIVILFVMVSVWGLVGLLTTTFGL